MALHWKLNKINDYYAVCYQDGKLTPHTECLLYATMAVGLPEITEKNSREFFKRLRLWEKVVGPFRFDKKGKDLYFSLEEVESHIGLSTNASKITKNAFLSKIWQHAEDQL